MPILLNKGQYNKTIETNFNELRGSIKNHKGK